MHIVIGILGTIVTILYLLNRIADLGLNFSALNPFYWARRRAWRKKYEGDPIFAIDDPMEIAALFVVGVAKHDGDMSAEQKQAAISEFASKFSLDDRDASHLAGSSAHLLSHPQVIRSQLDGLLERHKELFTAEQAESLIAMMNGVASAEGSPSQQQRDLLAAVQNQFASPPPGDGVWDQKG